MTVTRIHILLKCSAHEQHTITKRTCDRILFIFLVSRRSRFCTPRYKVRQPLSCKSLKVFADRLFSTDDCCKIRQFLKKKDQNLSESFIVVADHGNHNWGPCHRVLPTSFGILGFLQPHFPDFFGGWMLRKSTTFL